MEKKCPHCETVLTRTNDILGLTKLVNDTVMNNGQIITLDYVPLFCGTCGYTELELRNFIK